ncbi:magnesium and cobalt transport protein CorA [Halobacteriovorax marinus]|uniref:Magnesium transport protein CorA n=1 Tax=Halobacteriovorax marinus (strain ATCC BAA-682 / DSM 15412 / SJ) TaxID=862908 RepID=E1WX29_HALMS|nr:magnesium/cobalt transporter CorA [Halobacteriovorax marinus]ATH07125.1 magnesium and cobalt transport protein CorA [Halobacteriovorax marinus]CBW25730.1 putative transmembrane magnesium and cobalt transporter protein [Halobacteriovorax marinus SJ]
MIKKTKNTKDSKEIKHKPWMLTYVGDHQVSHDVSIESRSYDRASLSLKTYSSLDEYTSHSESDTTTWVEVNGIHDTTITKSVCEKAAVHGVNIEDILNTKQRPKIESNNEYIFVTLKAISYNEEKETFIKEQISIILKDNLVISFSQFPNDIFKRLKAELSVEDSFLRQKNAGFLFYRIIDLIVDGYFKVGDQIDSEIAIIEDALDNSDNEIIEDVYWLKKELLYLKKAIYPINDIVKHLVRTEKKNFSSETIFFFKDTMDHCLQINESISLNQELVTSFYDLYLSNINKKTNEVMMYLTLFSTIFIPLTYIVGVYGMNFKNMPELDYKYGYIAIMIVQFVIGIGIYSYFKKKKWLNSSE